MNISKLLSSRGLLAVLLALVIAAAICYQCGVYDIAFIERESTAQTELPPVDTVPDSSESSTDVPIANTPVSDTSIEEIPDSTAVQTQPATVTIDEFLATLYTTPRLIEAGYSVTDTVWEAGYAFGRADLSNVTTTEFSLNERTVDVPERIPYGQYSGYITMHKEVTEERPALEVYMDYIVADKGDSVDLLNADGTLLYENFNLSTYRPLYSRDKNDRPIFIAAIPSRYNPSNITTQYFYIDENGALAQSDYDDKTDSRGLYINYPTYYGKSQDPNFTRYYDAATTFYGFANINGFPRTDIKYLNVYNFSEDLACVVNQEGFMSFVTTNFVERIFSDTLSYHSHYNSSDRRVYYQYLRPDTLGEESLGFFYFDSGLVRVRRQIIDAPHYDMHKWREVNADEDVLICSDGSEFPIPTDYTVASYSNGMILLEKDGKYGFMNSAGKWVVQPVYSYAKPFNEGIAVVGNGEKMGMINKDGEFVIPMIFDYIDTVSGGIVTSWDESCGWIVLNKVVWIGN